MTARGRDDGGQATVELALVVPLVVMLALALVQVALVVRDQVLVIHAAREAAREAAVAEGTDRARDAALASGGLDGDRLRVEVGARGRAGSRVRVQIRYDAPTRVPLVGELVGDVALHASATMRVEQ